MGELESRSDMRTLVEAIARLRQEKADPAEIKSLNE